MKFIAFDSQKVGNLSFKDKINMKNNRINKKIINIT
jgi:hypothetical protein